MSPGRRGSALLLTILLTLAGAGVLGVAVDALALVWVRSNAQTTANLVAASVELELERNPGATEAYLLETARAAAAWNGYRHGVNSDSVQLEGRQGRQSILLERQAEVYFLRMIRRQPVAVRARAALSVPAGKAGL